jgi:hypothetical protein
MRCSDAPGTRDACSPDALGRLHGALRGFLADEEQVAAVVKRLQVEYMKIFLPGTKPELPGIGGAVSFLGEKALHFCYAHLVATMNAHKFVSFRSGAAGQEAALHNILEAHLKHLIRNREFFDVVGASTEQQADEYLAQQLK